MQSTSLMPRQALLGRDLNMAVFVGLGVLTTLAIPFCYAPSQLAELFPTSAGWLLETPLVRIATADRSGATMACIALLFYGFSRYVALSRQLRLQAEVLDKVISAARQGAVLTGPWIERLAARDVVRVFLEGAVARREGRAADPRATLELLRRYLARENVAVRRLIGPLVCLGLLGTLAGCWLGFVLTFGPSAAAQHGEQLHAALQQAVVVVATACISSVFGIGLGQLVLTPLADRIDAQVDAILDQAIVLENQLDLE